MLGGTAPVLVFNWTEVEILGFKIKNPSLFGIDIPLVSIPIYLDEKLTGIIVDDHERTINIEFETDGLGGNYEREISSDVKVTLKAQKDNIAFQGFLALFEQILKRIPAQSYKIYFYYDDVFMTNASLKDFAVSTMENTDTRVVTFTLTNRSEKSKAISSVLKKVGDSLKGFLK